MAEEGRGRKPFFHTPVCGRGQQQNSSGLGRTSQQHQFHWKWKTEPCRYFQRGYCYKGPTCTFIHEGEDEWPGFLFASPFLRLADVQPQRNSHGRRDTRNHLERFQSGPGQNEATNPGGAGFSEPLLCPYFLHEGKCADGENCPFAHDLIRRNFYTGSYMSTRNSYRQPPRANPGNHLEQFQSGPGQNEATNPGGAGFSEPLLCPYFLHEGKCADGENSYCPFAHDLIRRNFYTGSYMSTRNSYTRQQEDMYTDSARYWTEAAAVGASVFHPGNHLEQFQSGPGQNEATNPGGAGFSEPLLCPYFLHEGKCADGENSYCPFAHDLIRRNFYKGSYMSTRNSYTRQQEDMYIDSAARHAGSHSERTASYNSGHMRSDSYPEQTGLYSEHMYTDLDKENSASFRAWTKPMHEEDERPSRQVTRQPEDTVTESSARHTGSHPERSASYSGDMRSDSFSVQNGSYSELTNLNPENIASSSGSRALAPPTPEGETKEVYRYFQQGRCRKKFEEDCGFLHEGGQGSEGHKGEQLVSPKLSFGHKGIEGLGGTSSPRNLEEHKVEFLLPNLDDEAIHILMKRRMERDPRSVCKNLHSTFFSEPPLPPPLKLRTLWIGQEVIHIPVLNYDEIMMKRGERQRQACKLVESTVMPGAQDRQEELEEVDGPSEVP